MMYPIDYNENRLNIEIGNGGVAHTGISFGDCICLVDSG